MSAVPHQAFARLTEAGYVAMPLRHRLKRPFLKGWPDLLSSPPSAAQINAWDREQQRSPDRPIGILSGDLIGVDIDVLDPALADATQLLTERILGPCKLIRYGQRPKRMLVYRDPSNKIRKLRSSVFEIAGKTCLVEILGHRHQFVGYGIHERTGEPYDWPLDSLIDVRIEDIPKTSETALRRFLEEFEVLAEGAGGKRASRGSAFGDYPSGPQADKMGNLADAMAHLPNANLPYDDWIRVGIALKRAMPYNPGEAFSLFDDFSSQSYKYQFEFTSTTFDSFDASPRDSTAGAGTIYALAKKAGWTPPHPDARNDFDPVEEEDPVQGAPKSNAFEHFSQIEPDLTRQHLVKGVLPRTGTAGIIGPYGARKSQILFSLLISVALGEPWCGRKTLQGLVVYVSGEGREGVRARVKALRIDRKLEKDVPFALALSPPNLRDQNAVARFVSEVNEMAAGQPIRIVALDTLTSITPGMDQNSSQEMSSLVGALRFIERELDCLVLVVHHSGKDVGKGSRGSSVLPGDFDTELTVRVENDGLAYLSATKQRDLMRGPDMAFQQRVVVIGDDADGEEVTAALSDFITEAQADFAADAPTPTQRFTVECLAEAIAASETGLYASSRGWSACFADRHSRRHKSVNSQSKDIDALFRQHKSACVKKGLVREIALDQWVRV